MIEYLPIATAPKDGTVIRVCVIVDGKPQFEREASWEVRNFPVLPNPRTGEPFLEAETLARWVYPPGDISAGRPVGEPTHWAPLAE